jgi:virulence-associated protein VagC
MANQTAVFRDARGQFVRIPEEFSFAGDEVYIERDAKTGHVILVEAADWPKIFAMLDAAGVPQDFLEDRDRRPPEERAAFEVSDEDLLE